VPTLLRRPPRPPPPGASEIDQLLYATKTGDVHRLQHVMEQGVAVDLFLRSHQNALFEAVARGHAALARLVMFEEPLGFDFDGYDALLLLATAAGLEELGDFLLGRGVPPERADALALIRAARDGRADEVERLLGAGTDPNVPCHGVNALHFAAYRGHVRIMEALLAAGATADGSSPLRCTPLLLAVQGCRPAAIKLLLAAGASAGAGGQDYPSPLQVALMLKSRREAELLVDGGADVNTSNPHDGATTLSLAAFERDRPLMRKLLDLGANPNVATHTGACALSIACADADAGRFVSEGIVFMLLRRGADPALPKIRGRSFPRALNTGTQRSYLVEMMHRAERCWSVPLMRQTRRLARLDHGAVPADAADRDLLKALGYIKAGSWQARVLLRLLCAARLDLLMPWLALARVPQPEVSPETDRAADEEEEDDDGDGFASGGGGAPALQPAQWDRLSVALQEGILEMAFDGCVWLVSPRSRGRIPRRKRRHFV